MPPSDRGLYLDKWGSRPEPTPHWAEGFPFGWGEVPGRGTQSSSQDLGQMEGQLPCHAGLLANQRQMGLLLRIQQP